MARTNMTAFTVLAGFHAWLGWHSGKADPGVYRGDIEAAATHAIDFKQRPANQQRVRQHKFQSRFPVAAFGIDLATFDCGRVAIEPLRDRQPGKKGQQFHA